MYFDVSGGSYDRFMGRYADALARQFAELAGARPGQTALDVGCGPGALTSVLVSRLGPAAVAAVDPSEDFVAAAHHRLPDVDIRHGRAERLPFADRTFDVTVAQLVVHFLTEPAVGVAEMARVTRADGTVATCVWDFGGDRAPVSLFWRAARQITPQLADESTLAGARDGELAALLVDGGLRSVEQSVLEVVVDWPSFDEWWEPFTLGVGPAGAHLAQLEPAARAEVRAAAQQLVPAGPVSIHAAAWAATGQVPPA